MATTGEETIQLFDETQPDVAVVDIDMLLTNGLGGGYLAKALRQGELPAAVARTSAR